MKPKQTANPITNPTHWPSDDDDDDDTDEDNYDDVWLMSGESSKTSWSNVGG